MIDEFTVPFLALAFDTLVLAAIVTPTFRLILEMRKLRQVGFIERIVRDGKSDIHLLVFSRPDSASFNLMFYRQVCYTTCRTSTRLSLSLLIIGIRSVVLILDICMTKGNVSRSSSCEDHQ